MELSPDQSAAALKLRDFLKGDQKVFRLQGAAGCGKSTVISEILGSRDDVRYCAPTAKAATVLSDKGTEAVTIHSLMYQPVEVQDEFTGKPKLAFKENPRSPLWGGGILVIDEASMVAGFIAEALTKYPLKIIAVGDPFQLPPVKSSGSLLTGTPDALLTKVHRTALDSPVLELATYVRERGRLPDAFERGQTRIVSNGAEAGDLRRFDQILVGKHVTRFQTTSYLRKLKGRTSRLPEPGEFVLAKKNDPDNGIINGCQYEVKRVLADGKDMVYAELMDSNGFSIHTTAWTLGFQGETGRRKLEEMSFKDRAENTELWFSDAVTVHSAQGSEYDSVLVVDESKTFRNNAAKWLYTAITRAKDNVTVVKR